MALVVAVIVAQSHDGVRSECVDNRLNWLDRLHSSCRGTLLGSRDRHGQDQRQSDERSANNRRILHGHLDAADGRVVCRGQGPGNSGDGV